MERRGTLESERVLALWCEDAEPDWQTDPPCGTMGEYLMVPDSAYADLGCVPEKVSWEDSEIEEYAWSCYDEFETDELRWFECLVEAE